MDSYLNQDLTVLELLNLFPKGFSVGPNGHISEIVCATSSISILASYQPLPPGNGGYLVVDGVKQHELNRKLKAK